MKILYVASDQVVPGTTGGSIHVLEVAAGLAARGHEVHAVVRRRPGEAVEEAQDRLTWHRIEWWPPQRFFRFRAVSALRRIAARFAPDVVMERYYNFGGEGVTLAVERGIPALLEVNSPIVDHPGSVKAALDALLLVRPLRRYREGLCRRARALVAPILEIVPEEARTKTEIVTWGANVARFHPRHRSLTLRQEWGAREEATVVLFSGSCRPWHGVHFFEDIARRLRSRADLYFVLAGGEEAGPGRGYQGRRLGPVPYERMPEVVASADVGIAPYDTQRLAQLRLGFFWSPLKVFEYMASGLPTVTIERAPLSTIVRDGEEGLLFPEGRLEQLVASLTRLADDAPLRQRLGANARRRVEARYSWDRHCEQLEGVLRRIVG